jgi:hypothetical protein
MQKVLLAAFYVSDSRPSHAFATAHTCMAYVERLRNTQLILQASPSSAPVLHDLFVGVNFGEIVIHIADAEVTLIHTARLASPGGDIPRTMNALNPMQDS